VSDNRPPANIVPTQKEDFLSLAKRIKAGDTTALSTLRELFQQQGWADSAGNLAKLAQQRLIATIVTDTACREVLSCQLDHLRVELSGPNPSPLESLLVQRIITCWLHLHYLEVLYTGKQSEKLVIGEYLDRSIDRAHKRYLSAIKALATVRRLAVPILVGQVNIASQQKNIVNMAG
jgi:hypothetical protein